MTIGAPYINNDRSPYHNHKTINQDLSDVARNNQRSYINNRSTFDQHSSESIGERRLIKDNSSVFFTEVDSILEPSVVNFPREQSRDMNYLRRNKVHKGD